MDLFYPLLLGFAVSIDSFAAGIAYGLKNIRISFNSLAVVGLTTAGCTGLAMLLANVLGRFVDMRAAVFAGSILLISLGGFSLFQEYFTKNISAYGMNGNNTGNQLTFSLGRLVISIMTKPEAADFDNSKSINSVEAFLLGLALGIDNIVASFAASLLGLLPLYTPLLMGIAQMIFLSTGGLAACRLVSESWKSRFPFLPGTILIVIGLIRLN